ncbi:MAG: DUF427 domain-containing protein [Brumimicrobium sp.]|nr:DUF427 domain-containing protein [Brumimicrobium sp.]
MKAIWNDQIIAESNETIIVENNHYFPPSSVNEEFLEESDTTSKCPWKGKASYYHVVVEGKKNEDAAWYYPDPKDAASEIEDYIAFWNGVKVKE